jgi:TolB-like protein
MRVRTLLISALLAASVAPTAALAQAKPAAAKKASKEDEAAAAAAAAAAAEEAKKKADADAAAAAAADEAKKQAEAEASAKAAADAAAAEQTKAREAALAARGLDARIRALADSLAIPLKRLPGDHRDQRFAVVTFEAVGQEAIDRSLGVVVTDLVVTDLARDHRLGLVERAQLNKIMDEMALQQSGAVDDKQAVEIGKLSGARALILGRVADAGEDFIVSARAVDAESGTVLVAEDVKVPKAELVAFSANAVVLRSRSGAMFRSVVVPGWGQSYNNQTTKGYIFGAVTGGLVLATAVTGGVGAYTALSVYPSACGDADATCKDLAQADRPDYVSGIRQNANNTLTAAAVLAGVTAGVWAINVADAWLSGVDTESLDAALAKN